jgi:hypothetical protein
MSRFFKFINTVMISSILVSGGLVGCTKKPNNEESSKLQEARAAAESAEQKLSELRQERIKLEQQAQPKETPAP